MPEGHTIRPAQGLLVSAAREEILDRIRAAVGAGGAPSPAGSGRAATPAQLDAAYAALPRPYRRAHHDPGDTDIVALFAERAADYRAIVERVPEADLPAAVARALAGVPTFLVPDGLPPEWLADESADEDRVVRDDPPLSARELDAIAGVVTGCAVAVAETGTIILDHGPGQGRRALTLVPDFHLVVVRSSTRWRRTCLTPSPGWTRPAQHTLISGPRPPARHRAHPGRGRARPQEPARPHRRLTLIRRNAVGRARAHAGPFATRRAA